MTPEFSTVRAGDELPAVIRPPITITQLVMYCGAAQVFDPVHFSAEHAHASDFPDVIVNGSMRVAFLSQLMTDWIGTAGHLRRLGCRHRGMVLLGDRVVTRGRVLSTRVEDGVGLVECEIWNETETLERADQGTALIALPLGET